MLKISEVAFLCLSGILSSLFFGLAFSIAVLSFSSFLFLDEPEISNVFKILFFASGIFFSWAFRPVFFHNNPEKGRVFIFSAIAAAFFFSIITYPIEEIVLLVPNLF